MTAPRHYDTAPRIAIGEAADATAGAAAIARRLAATQAQVIAIECYPGVRRRDLAEMLTALAPAAIIDTDRLLLPPAQIMALTADCLTEDPVFGRISRLELRDLVDAAALTELQQRLAGAPRPVCVVGIGASLVADATVSGRTLVYATLPRWEATLRQRRGEVTNLGLDNAGASPGEMYRRGYFIDWRIADRWRRQLWPQLEWLLDTSGATPVMVSAPGMWTALQRLTQRPFRFVPYFDPAPWGGQWMQRVCNTGRDRPNLGWCFDCVPEENSLLVGFGPHTYQLPGLELVLREPVGLLGEAVYGRFGAEFPIRTDFLDTMGGGNLSLQVHPQTEYMREHFGLSYTQDESYYVLDAGPQGAVHLGVVDGADRDALARDLHASEAGADFPVAAHINRFPAQAHDHFLIPAGTVHGSASDTMVLEISATPYIFTFKLHDWNRPGLDGRPRPLHINRGLANLRMDRDASYARERLINQITPIAAGDGWSEERTGLHEAEFIETRRHWFTVPVEHRGGGRFSVITVVAGEGVVVESVDSSFEPYPVSYAETVVVPAAIGDFRIRPLVEGQRCATIRAYVRTAA